MSKNVGDRLKELVKEKGLEQQQIAFELNIKSPTFSGYVSNKREPSIDKLKYFAKHFEISVDYLIGYSDIRDPYLKHLPEDIREFILDPDNLDYIELARDIKERTLMVNKKKLFSNKT